MDTKEELLSDLFFCEHFLKAAEKERGRYTAIARWSDQICAEVEALDAEIQALQADKEELEELLRTFS